ncbi:MAG: hypothetical protein Kow0090_19170 [Myxococcota bacterium]
MKKCFKVMWLWSATLLTAAVFLSCSLTPGEPLAPGDDDDKTAGKDDDDDNNDDNSADDDDETNDDDADDDDTADDDDIVDDDDNDDDDIVDDDDNDADDEKPCEKLTVEECGVNPLCFVIEGAPIKNGSCIDLKAKKGLGCMYAAGTCGAAETLATGPDGEVFWFSSTCIPEDFVPCDMIQNPLKECYVTAFCEEEWGECEEKIADLESAIKEALDTRNDCAVHSECAFVATYVDCFPSCGYTVNTKNVEDFKKNIETITNEFCSDEFYKECPMGFPGGCPALEGVCIKGKCQLEPNGGERWCEDFGGLCIGWGPECPEGYGYPSGVLYECRNGGQCCLPLPDCGEYGCCVTPADCKAGFPDGCFGQNYEAWACREGRCEPECINPYEDTCSPAGGKCVIGTNECPEGSVISKDPAIHCLERGFAMETCCMPLDDSWVSCRDSVRDCPDFAPIKCIGYWHCDEKIGDDCNYSCGEPPPCPQWAPPPPDWCDDGVIVSGGHTGEGCPLPPKCLPFKECLSDKGCAASEYCDFCIHPGSSDPAVAGICRSIADAPLGCKSDIDCEFGMSCVAIDNGWSPYGSNRDNCNMPLPEKKCQMLMK